MTEAQGDQLIALLTQLLQWMGLFSFEASIGVMLLVACAFVRYREGN